MGLDPLRLFSLSLRQFFAYVRGWRREKAEREAQLRNIYGVLVMANRDTKKAVPVIEKMWPIPILDNVEVEEREQIDTRGKKEQLLKAWRIE
jgi:hypothetical protein